MMYSNGRTLYEEGGVPPLDPPPPLLPFQCLRLTAKILLRPLRCQEDLRLKRFGTFGGDHRGTLGGGGSQPNPPPPPPMQTPPSPLVIHPW